MSENNPDKPAPQSRPILKHAGQARAAEREARRAAALRANLTRRKVQTRARDAGDAPETTSLTPGGLEAGHGPDPKA